MISEESQKDITDFFKDSKSVKTYIMEEQEGRW